ncbi:MAG: response regulator [Deltaproteobacteria bacterium]|nr:response regulator [Deltaproteobacteria bacterium]
MLLVLDGRLGHPLPFCKGWASQVLARLPTPRVTHCCLKTSPRLADTTNVASRDSTADLLPVVRERGRRLWASAVIGHTLIVALAAPLGIMPPLPVYMFDFAMLGVAFVLAALLFMKRVPERLLLVASAGLQWTGLLSIVASMYATNRQAYAVFFLLQLSNAAVSLDTRVATATVALVTGFAIPLLIRCGGHDAPTFIAAIVIGGAASFVVHLTMRRSLAISEKHRQDAAESAQQLSRQLDELRNSNEQRERLHDQLLHSQRMEAIGTLAAGMAHDMNNVLASVRSLGHLLLTDITDAKQRADVEQIIAQTERGAALTRGLLAFSRRGQYRKKIVRLDEVVREVLPLIERTLPKSITVKTELRLIDASVEADATQLEQVLVNLALNAKDAMDGSGTLTISTDLDVDANRASITVSDTGCGMDEATKRRAFEPFFTTKPQGKGTGLGLSTVWGIVEQHGGSVTVDSAPGRGATFTMRLPISKAKPTTMPTRVLSEQAVVRGTVLLVDDEQAVRMTSKRLLERMGLDVVMAENGAEALDQFAKHAADIRLVVLDMGMPVMGGAECFRRLRERSSVPVLIATGYSNDEEAQSLVSAGATILEKPFSSAQLKAEVLRLITSEQSARHVAVSQAQLRAV